MHQVLHALPKLEPFGNWHKPRLDSLLCPTGSGVFEQGIIPGIASILAIVIDKDLVPADDVH